MLLQVYKMIVQRAITEEQVSGCRVIMFFHVSCKNKMKVLKELNETEIRSVLDRQGYAHLPAVLTPQECDTIRKLYDQEALFRSTVNMERYRFGKGEYKYLNYPLPQLVESIRSEFYPLLVPIANDWMEKLQLGIRYPVDHKEFLSVCHEQGQRRPTPLILRYEADGYNTLHQDLYGEVYFPFQVVVMLTRRGMDYAGGDLVFVEQLPRAQSRAQVLDLAQGDAVIFTTNFRPVKGARGFYRARMKHGVSQVTSGTRFTMGIIFHDAK